MGSIRCVKMNYITSNYYYFSFNHCIQLDQKYVDAWNGKGIALDDLGRY